LFYLTTKGNLISVLKMVYSLSKLIVSN